MTVVGQNIWSKDGGLLGHTRIVTYITKQKLAEKWFKYQQKGRSNLISWHDRKKSFKNCQNIILIVLMKLVSFLV